MWLRFDDDALGLGKRTHLAVRLWSAALEEGVSGMSNNYAFPMENLIKSILEARKAGEISEYEALHLSALLAIAERLDALAQQRDKPIILERQKTCGHAQTEWCNCDE